ncbi:MAG: carboxypeptidase regulatory-like domain-containing protein [Bacteroidota bacterium]|nr:carboxypeptidase regulatory-like domain-containing protein [Bacteroidota bacterium]
MRKPSRIALLAALLVVTTALAQNSRVYMVIEPNSPDPTMPLIVEPGKSIHFTAKAYEYQASNRQPVEVALQSVSWSVVPNTLGTITQTGDFTAASTTVPGTVPTGQVIATGTYGQVTLQASVAVRIGNGTNTPTFDYTITGTVTDVSHGPIPAATISAFDPAQRTTNVLTARTDANGRYSLKVPAGSYYVTATAPGYITEYYDDAKSQDKATRVNTDPTNKTVQGIDFTLSRGGRISGRVTATDRNVPIEGATISITVYSGGGPSILPIFQTVSGRDGRYSYEGLPAGKYVAEARYQGYIPQYYDRKATVQDADSIVLSEGGTADNIDFLSEKSPGNPGTLFRISGIVTDESSTPIAGALISAENTLTMPPVAQFYRIRSDQDGKYVLTVPGGAYLVRAEAQGYLSEYFDNARTPDKATLVTVDATHPQATGVDFRLGTGGVITGKVTDLANAAPIEGCLVTVGGTVNGNPSSNIGATGPYALTNASGEYRITGLETGEYTVFASKHGYSGQYYDHVPDVSQATKVKVLEGQETTGIDFSLSGLPAITGTVWNTSSQAVPFATVVATSVAATPTQPVKSFATRSAQNGTYRLVVPAGKYKVQASAVGYLTEFYQEKPDAASADEVTVPATGGDVSGIDFTLGTGGSISGTVLRAADNTPIENATVRILTSSRSDPTNSGSIFGAAVTDRQGNYLITGLPTGDYVVFAEKAGFETQYYDGTDDPAKASKVHVESDRTTTGINFALLDLPAVSGTVRDAATNLPIARAEIYFENSPGTKRFTTTTDANGSYMVHLPRGIYIARASAPQYAAQWYNGKTKADQADPITVTSGTVPNIDFALTPWGGAISGIVVDAANAPIEGALVKAWSPSTVNNPTSRVTYYGTTKTAADGSYRVAGLPAGEYYVSVQAAGYLREFYDNAPNLQSASRVVVTDNATTAGIDFVLEKGGSITGLVTDAVTNAPIANALVALRVNAGVNEQGIRTNAQGVYSIDGLASGEYIVFATAPNYLTEYYDDVNDPALATKVRVTAPAATTGIDFALTPAPTRRLRFAGTVLDRASGLPVMHALVEGIDALTGASILTTTDEQGAFAMTNDQPLLLRARGIGYIGVYAGDNLNWEESARHILTGDALFALDAVSECGLGTFHGKVIESSSRKAVPNAWVYGSDDAGNRFFAVTDDEGNFALDGIDDGVLQFYVSGVAYSPADGSGETRQGFGTAVVSVRKNDATVGAENPTVPLRPFLAQNYPNPFNPSTVITFGIPAASQVSLTVQNLLGSRVATLLEGRMDAGTYTVHWDASSLPAGVYLYRLENEGTVLTRRMLLVK